MNKKPILVAALVASAIAGSGHAFAGNDSQAGDRAEMQAALAAKVPMVQAIQAAESQSGGTGMEASFSIENGTAGYEVTTVTKDGVEHNLFVDVTTGKASKASPEENENDDNGAPDSEEGE
jgi:uncharacterized membrane protein YkoI